MNAVSVLFGGSFNPPTLAHAAAVETLRAALPDLLITLLPAPRVVHKDPATLAPLDDRMAMLQLMAQGMANVTVSNFAAQVDSPQTVDLLVTYRAAFPGTHIIWVMGADSFVSLPQWQDWRSIMETTALYVLARDEQVAGIHTTLPAQDYAELKRKSAADLCAGPGWYMDPRFHAPFSATAVRQALAQGETSPYLADDVAAYVTARGLYV